VKRSTANTYPRDPADGKLGPAVQDRHIEVAVTHNGDGSRQVLLQDLSYGQGIGWYAQKTIRLDSQQVDAILGALCCMRQAAVKNPPSTTCGRKEAQIISLERPA